MVFEGRYHSEVFNFEHGSTPVNYLILWVLAPYNDPEGTLALIDQHEADLAAVIIEPMVGASGGIPTEKDFLQGLRDATQEKGIILLFDEVMTPRHGPNGYQGEVGITPDLASVSKYPGGSSVRTLPAESPAVWLDPRREPSRCAAMIQAATFHQKNRRDPTPRIAPLRHARPW